MTSFSCWTHSSTHLIVPPSDWSLVFISLAYCVFHLVVTSEWSIRLCCMQALRNQWMTVHWAPSPESVSGAVGASIVRIRCKRWSPAFYLPSTNSSKIVHLMTHIRRVLAQPLAACLHPNTLHWLLVFIPTPAIGCLSSSKHPSIPFSLNHWLPVFIQPHTIQCSQNHRLTVFTNHLSIQFSPNH